MKRTAIETQALTRHFGRQTAVDQVSLAVPEGAVFGFLGQNGAGKTTTIRLLLGLLKPTAGSAFVFGHDVRKERMTAARLVGALVETPSHYDHLTGRENLAITRRLLGAPASEIDRVLETVDLAEAADRRVGGYSLGMRQRLGIARALLGRPRVLILDEPTNGLDPHGILDMRNLISQLAASEGVTILFSSHILAEVEQTATHVGLMHEGRLLLQSSIEELSSAHSSIVRFKVDRPADTTALLCTLGLEATEAAPDEVLVATSERLGAQDIAELNTRLVTEGVRVSGLEVREPSLEDIFVSVIERSRAASLATLVK